MAIGVRHPITDTSGSRAKPSVRATGGPTQTVAGFTAMPAGPGFQKSRLAGPLTTTVAGRACATSAGFGFRATNGRRPGFRGARAMITSAGRRCPPEARFDRRTGIHNWSDNYYDIGPDQYSFVPTAEFGAQRVEGTVVPSERNVVIINQTTNVTNITYSNTTIVNQGPSYDELRTRTRQPIARLRLEREMNVDPNAEARPVVRGEVVFMPAPLIARGQAVERPKTVKEPVATVVVDRGWEGIGDRQAAEKARAKMKSESTPPTDAPSKTFVKPAHAASNNRRSRNPAQSKSQGCRQLQFLQRAQPAAPVRTTSLPATSTPSPSPARRRRRNRYDIGRDNGDAIPARKATVPPTRRHRLLREQRRQHENALIAGLRRRRPRRRRLTTAPCFYSPASPTVPPDKLPPTPVRSPAATAQTHQLRTIVPSPSGVYAKGRIHSSSKQNRKNGIKGGRDPSQVSGKAIR